MPARFTIKFAKSKWIALLLLLCLLLPTNVESALAQSGDSPWIPYQEEDGLASNDVWSILPLEREIWFGTADGISRFNGEWISWRSGDEIPRGAVKALAKGSKSGTVWAGTTSGAVIYWNGEGWQTVVTLDAPVQALHLADGQLWMGTSEGLFIWNGTEEIMAVDALANLSIQSLVSHANTIWVGTNDGLWLYQRQTWSQITEEDGLPGNNVTSLWIDPDGPVWIGTTTGLARRDSITGTWIEIPTESLDGGPYHIVSLAGDALGEVWGATNGDGAIRYTNGNLITLGGDIGLTTPLVQAVAVDPNGSVWFGTPSGVFRHDVRLWVKEFLDPTTYLQIEDLLVDDQDRLWVATRGGIRLKHNAEQSSLGDDLLTAENSELPANYVTQLEMDERGILWAGTFEGVAYYDEETERWVMPFDAESLPSKAVTALLAHGAGLWIGTEQGLAHYDIVRDELRPILEFRDTVVESLAMDSLQQIWVGTRSSGLHVQDEAGAWIQMTPDPLDTNASGITSAVTALYPDPNFSGGMWVALNRRGLMQWNGEEWIDYTSISRLPSNLIYTLYTDPKDGTLWVGSEGGVSRYDRRTWETLHVEGILPNAPIYAVVRTKEGSYWFGSKDGITYYRPEATPPWIRIEEVSGSVTRVSSDRVQIQAGERMGINFVAGDLHTDPSELEILYRISGPGHNDEWQPVSGGFFSLSAFEETGNYLVDLQARDESFNYSEVVRLGVEVLPPPPTVTLPLLGRVPQDTFFALLVTTLIALVGFGYMSLEILQNRRRTQEALIRGFNPFVSGEPVRRQDMFFGRYDLLQRIIDTLHNNSIMIHGERRIGKTTLLYQLAARLREVDDPEYWFIPLYIDLEGTTEEVFFHFLMEEILHGTLTLPEARERLQPQLEELSYHSTPTDKYTDREFGRDLRAVIRVLQDYGDEMHPGKQLRLILLLDEMDVMSSYSRVVQQRLRRIFMRDFAATLGAVVAGIRISKEWDRIESPWYNLFNEIELGPFNREQAMELLTAPVQDTYRYEPAALEFIIEHSDGRPFRLQQYALEAINHMLAEGRRTITLQDVEAAHEHIMHHGNDNNVGLAASPKGEGSVSKEDEVQMESEPVQPAT